MRPDQLETLFLIQAVAIVEIGIALVVIRLLNLHLPFPRDISELTQRFSGNYSGLDPEKVRANKWAWRVVVLVIGISMFVVFALKRQGHL